VSKPSKKSEIVRDGNAIRSEYSQSAFKGRGSLTQIVRELERQLAARVDFTADTRDVKFTVADKGGIRLVPANQNLHDSGWVPEGGYGILDQALLQIGAKSTPTVPGDFLRLLTSMRPARAADLLTGLLHDGPAVRTFRALDGNLRAFLSNSFRMIDSYDSTKTLLSEAKRLNLMPIEGTLSDSNVRIKLISKELWDVIEEKRTQDGGKGGWYAGGLGNQEWLSKVAARTMGDLPGGPGTIHPSLSFRNSETGHGGFELDGGIMKGICFNLATVEELFAKIHLGARQAANQIFSQQTNDKEAELIHAQIREIVTAFFTKEHFEGLVASIKGTQQDKIVKPTGAVNLLVQRNPDVLTEENVDDLLNFFVAEQNPTVMGLAQAVARYSQETQDVEKVAGLEWLAGSLMSGKQSKELVAAGA